MRYKGKEVIRMPHYGESSYRRYLLGDLNALEDLVRECSDSVVRFAYCFVKDASAAEDVMEDALTDLLLKKKRFASEAQFKAYLYKAVRHRALDYLRRNRNHIPLEDVENILSCEDSQSDILKQQRNEVLYICMGSLPEQYREVLILSYFEELVCELCKM